MPVYRVQGPDGKIHRIEGPEGASPAEIESFAEQSFGSMPSGHAPVHTGKTENENDPKGGDLGVHVQHDGNGTFGKLARQAGLTARYIAEGVPGIPLMVGDAVNALIDNGLEAAGFDYRLGPASKAVSDGLTAIGLPKPETPTERVVGDVSRAVAGMNIQKTIGDVATKSTNRVAQEVGKLLNANMGAQAAAQVSGTGSAGIAREAGAGPGMQLAAGVVGGFGIPGAYTIGKEAAHRGYGVAKEVFKPTDEIVGATMKKLASDPDASLKKLRSAKEIIPGSPYTTAEAAQDLGLMSAQRAIKNKNPTDFADIASRQNTARNQYLDDLAGNEAILKRTVEQRDGQTAPLREAAFQNKNPVDIKPIRDLIYSVKKAPKGERQDVESAMNWVQSRLKGLSDYEEIPKTTMDSFGSSVETSLKGADPERLYALRQDINDAMQGKYDQIEPSLRLAKSQLKAVKDALDGVIESGAPGYREYLAKYSELSRPINQMETLQDIRGRITNTAPDTTGYSFLSQPKLTNVMKEDYSRTLTNEQTEKLATLLQDMDRSATLNNPSIRPYGSDTFSNAAGNDLLRQALTEKIKSVPGGKYIAALRQNSLDDRLKEAFTTPELAALLMSQAQPPAQIRSIDPMKQALIAELLGANLATASYQR
jgi:hypothetical protein